jgi:hypothetical protein
MWSPSLRQQKPGFHHVTFSKDYSSAVVYAPSGNFKVDLQP